MGGGDTKENSVSTAQEDCLTNMFVRLLVLADMDRPGVLGLLKLISFDWAKRCWRNSKRSKRDLMGNRELMGSP